MRRLIDAIRTLVALVEHWTVLITDKGVDLVLNLFRGRVRAAITWLVKDWPVEVGNMKAQAEGVSKLIDLVGGEISDLTEPHFRALAAKAFAEVAQTLTVTGAAQPADWKKNAAAAIGDAYSFGFKSWATTLGFEAVFPEKLNVLNGTAAMFAEMAGFAEVTKAWLGPNLKSAVGRLAEYDSNNRNRSVQLVSQVALNLYSRGLISQTACEQFLAYAGHPDKDIAALMAGAFHPLRPQVLAQSLSDGSISDAEIRDAMVYAGFRPADTDLMISAFHQRIQQPYRQSALRAVKTAFQRGLITQSELNDAFNTLSIPAEVQGFINLEMGYTKLVELADLYRRGLDEAATYGLEPLPSYVTDLEAIGLSKADADAHFAIISNKVRGKALEAAERADAAAARASLRQRTVALQAQYESGNIPDAGVVAALIALGYAPGPAATIFAAWQARKQGRQRLIYGRLLAPIDANLLQEQVAPVLANRAKGLITDAVALAVLKSLGIPLVNAEALVAEAAARHAKKK